MARPEEGSLSNCHIFNRGTHRKHDVGRSFRRANDAWLEPKSASINPAARKVAAGPAVLELFRIIGDADFANRPLSPPRTGL
jgi:hypothetical protein